jgi:hypothetical protein
LKAIAAQCWSPWNTESIRAIEKHSSKRWRSSSTRRRDGAYAWGVFEDAAHPGRMVETFLIESWMEHLRQHERVTKADRLLQEEIRRFDRSGNPKVTHFIAADT